MYEWDHAGASQGITSTLQCRKTLELASGVPCRLFYRGGVTSSPTAKVELNPSSNRPLVDLRQALNDLEEGYDHLLYLVETRTLLEDLRVNRVDVSMDIAPVKKPVLILEMLSKIYVPYQGNVATMKNGRMQSISIGNNSQGYMKIYNKGVQARRKTTTLRFEAQLQNEALVDGRIRTVSDLTLEKLGSAWMDKIQPVLGCLLA
jgi:hypothetical protein